MQLVHINQIGPMYIHGDLYVEGVAFDSGAPLRILDLCPTWGCRATRDSFGLVAKLNPSHVIVMRDYESARTIEALAEVTKVVVQAPVYDWKDTLRRFPMLHALMSNESHSQESSRIEQILQFIGGDLITIPLWLRDLDQTRLPESLRILGSTLEPYITTLLTSEAANAACYGMLFDPLHGQRIQLPNYNLDYTPASPIIFAYNRLCLESWLQGVNPITFTQFLLSKSEA